MSPEKSTLIPQTDTFSFLTEYQDSFNAVLTTGASLAQAQEVLALGGALAPILQEARLRAEHIVRQRGENGHLFATLSDDVIANVKQSLGDVGEPRVAFHKLTGVLYFVSDGLPQSIIDWEIETGRRPDPNKTEEVAQEEGASLT